MRKLALSAAVAMVLAVPALAEDWDFVLVNNTGKTIKTIEISPAGGGSWQPNRIDAELRKETAIKAGAKTTIHFDKGSGCKYDVRATFEDGGTAVWNGFDVCNNSYLTVSYSNGTPSFKAN